MALDFNAISGLTTADSTRLQVIIQVSPHSINPYFADRRAAFERTNRSLTTPTRLKPTVRQEPCPNRYT
jgi:hypothetical protein